MRASSTSQTLSASEINALVRGVAISAVIAIHVIANIPHAFQITSSGWVYFLVIDQVSRFCVPLFIMLSGYGFWKKYQNKELNWLHFWKRQALKLLPLYILASLIFYLIFLFVPHWRNPEAPHSFIIQLLTGKADYQLYFVPAIFQLYLLFPLLRKVVQKLPWITLGVAGVFQVWLYALYNTPSPSHFISTYLLTDQQQYVWFFTWIFYFILGMHLPKISAWFYKRSVRIGFLGLAAAVTLLMTILQAHVQLTHGIDPIMVLRFTRIDVLGYATLMSVLIFAFIRQLNKQHSYIRMIVLLLGKYSYQIYLFHAMLLRMLFSL